MHRPLIVLISGRPASGKTSLAEIISKKIKCPLISRDQLKEGYVHTQGIPHSQLDDSAAIHIYDTFFETISLLIEKGISIIIEAAFQDKLWKPKLLSLSKHAIIKIIICNTSRELLETRFKNRLLKDPDRERYHGDNLALVSEEGGLFSKPYEAINMNLASLEVDTTDNYDPGIEEIVKFILQTE